MQNCTNEGRVNNNCLLPTQHHGMNTDSEAKVICLCNNMLGGLLSLVWHQLQGFFHIWHTAAVKLTASLMDSHLPLSFISQKNCASLITQLRLMLQPLVKTRHLRSH